MRRIISIAVCSLFLTGLLVHTAFANWTVTLGPSDTLASDQPVVAVGVYSLHGSSLLGAQLYNPFVLDSGSTTILAGQNATQELISSPAFHTVATYYESGIGGSTPTEVSDPYLFGYAGVNGNQSLPSVRILASDQDVGFDGVAG